MPKKKKEKKKRVLVRSEERDEGRERQMFKVRCSLETAFYAFVEAHDADEAKLVAENWCRESDAKRGDGLFWDSEATYKHSKFEAEEA